MRLALILSVIGFLFLLPVSARAQEKLVWLKTEWPPVFMENGGGFGDHALAWLIERLPEYSHEIRSLPLARLLKTLERTDAAVCASGLARNPAREAQFLVSHDLMHMPGLALVTRADEAETFRALRNADGMIELRRLLEQSELDGAVHDSRSYGPALDERLRSAPPSAPVVRLSKTGTMLSMLAAKRVDWLLLYPFEATWQVRQAQKEGAATPAITSLPLAEAPPAIRGGITCNQTRGSEAAVAKINRLITAHPDRPWLRSMLDWLDPEARKRLAGMH